MFILDTNVLQAGDIVLTTQDAPVSKVVRKTTGSPFSHAILYLGHGSYIHSDSAGVHADNPQRLLFRKHEYAKVLRLKSNNLLAIEQICIFARTQIGKQYSVPEAIKSKVYRKISSSETSNRQFCSRLVAQAYAFAGIHLVPNPDFCYPKDIGDSNQLYIVNDSVRKASDNELYIASSDSPLKKQEQVTNYILTEVRKVSKEDIQTFEQVVNLLLASPFHDKVISEIVQKSGYLYLWKIDVDRNAWRYDSMNFLGLPIQREQKLALANDELVAAEKQLVQFKFMYSQYMTLWRRAQLSYFAQELQLYLTLIELTTSRVAAAKYVLDNA